jgi:Mn2+/Fe2+ NRAMP family transporter
MACTGESLREIHHAGRARASGEHENENENENENDSEAALARRLLGAHLAGLVFGVAILAAATVFVCGVLHVI